MPSSRYDNARLRSFHCCLCMRIKYIITSSSTIRYSQTKYSVVIQYLYVSFLVLLSGGVRKLLFDIHIHIEDLKAG